MNKFKWGHTFIELNHDILEDYSHVNGQKNYRNRKRIFSKLI